MTMIASHDAERTALAGRLAHLCAQAKRQQYLTAKFHDDEPTAWDLVHIEIDAVLHELEALR